MVSIVIIKSYSIKIRYIREITKLFKIIFKRIVFDITLSIMCTYKCKCFKFRSAFVFEIFCVVSNILTVLKARVCSNLIKEWIFVFHLFCSVGKLNILCNNYLQNNWWLANSIQNVFWPIKIKWTDVCKNDNSVIDWELFLFPF